MDWFFAALFSSAVSLFGVLGLQNLTFFGEYVVFKPVTKFIKFDLYEEIDVLLLHHRTSKVGAKLQDIDYLYRIHLILDDRETEAYSVNCSIFNRTKKMVTGHYQFWNQTEKDNMAIRWGTEKNIIEVLTELEGQHNTIFSWRDRSKNRTSVRYVGLAVAPRADVAPGAEENSTSTEERRHLNWKIREAEPIDFDLRSAYRICEINFLPAHPREKPKSIYQMFMTREEDENYAMSVQKGSTEVMRTKMTRIDPEKIALSFDPENSIISFGRQNETSPVFLWQDAEATKDDFARIKFISFFLYKEKKWLVKNLTSDKLLTIPELFPKYFTGSPITLTTTTPPQSITEMAMSNSTQPTNPSGDPSSAEKYNLVDESIDK